MRLATQTSVMCVCFQRRRVRHNANDVPDRRAFASKERNLHCVVHVTAENKTHITAIWAARLDLDDAIAATPGVAIKPYVLIFITIPYHDGSRFSGTFSDKRLTPVVFLLGSVRICSST